MKRKKINEMYKFCLIMGGGNLPFEILKNFSKDEVFVIAIKEAEINFDYLEGFNFQVISFLKVGKLFKEIKAKGIKRVCFAGRVKKPNFMVARPDLGGFILLFKLIRLKMKGDDAVLKTIIEYVENKGFQVASAGEICKNLIMKKEILTKTKPSSSAMKDATLGIEILEGISHFDIGQAIVVQDGVVLGVEGVEGTDELILRCGKLKFQKGNSPVLIKSAKLGQTMKIDMPVIGLKTIENLKEAGFSGVAVKAQTALFLEQKEAIEMANQCGIFIIGI